MKKKKFLKLIKKHGYTPEETWDKIIQPKILNLGVDCAGPDKDAPDLEEVNKLRPSNVFSDIEENKVKIGKSFIGKEKDLYRSLKNFIRLDKPKTQDYMLLFMSIVRVTKQGSGLMWKDVQAIVKYVLTN